MPARRETLPGEVQREVQRQNKTLQCFLGGQNKGPSWLTGATDTSSRQTRILPPKATTQATPANPSPGSPLAEPRNIPQPRPAAQEQTVTRDVSSASASPHLPNMQRPPAVPQVQHSPFPSSISPPQTPEIPTHVVTAQGHVQHTSPRAGQLSEPALVAGLKRKEMDSNGQDAQTKRIQTSIHPTRAMQPSPNANIGHFPNPNGMLPAATGASGTATGQPLQPQGSAQFPSGNWQNIRGPVPAYGAYAVQTPYNQGLMPCPPLSPAQFVALQQQMAATARSPTIPSPSQQYPSPVSQNGRSIPSPQVLDSSQNIAQNQARPQGQAPPKHPFPVVEPYSKATCGQYIQNYRRSRQMSGLPSLNPSEGNRLILLESATENEDSVFLFLHQIISMHARDPNSLPPIIRNKPGFLEAAKLVNMILGSENIRTEDLASFFAVMPWPLQNVATERPQTYQEGINYLEHFVVDLLTGWTTLIEVCKKRNSPPLASELWDLRITSPTLMEIFFHAALCRVWRDLGGLHAKALKMHSHDRNHLYWLLTQENLTMNPSLKAKADHVFAPKFAALVAEAEAAHVAQAMERDTLQPPIPYAAPVHMRVRSGSLVQPLPYAQDRPSLAAWPAQGHGSPNPRNPNPATRIQAPSSNLLFPERGARMPDQTSTPTWELSALHQAHLRDPQYGDPNSLAVVARSALLYQYVHSFAISPSRLKADEYQQRHAWFVTELDMSCVPETKSYDDGRQKQRALREGSRQYRLRLAKIGEPPQGEDDALGKDWMLKQTSFPLHAYFKINGQRLEVRRKMHHTKDLPVDITEHICFGINRLEIFLHVKPGDKEMSKYAFAIEVVDAQTHGAILLQCENRIIPSQEVLAPVVENLLRSASGGDNDDLIIDTANSKTTIQIFDPIGQGKICELPARGVDCRHRECFDLHTFLQSRTRDRPAWPTHCDVWRCPICLGDVRPQNIVIDGFMMEVRQKLLSEGKGDVRAIMISSDGSWAPKIEEVRGQSDGEERDSAQQSATSSPEPPTMSLKRSSSLVQSLPVATTQGLDGCIVLGCKRRGQGLRTFCDYHSCQDQGERCMGLAREGATTCQACWDAQIQSAKMSRGPTAANSVEHRRSVTTASRAPVVIELSDDDDD